MSPTLPMPSCSTEFFGFSHRPFRGTPAPADYVPIDATDQEVQRLAAAASQGDGIAVLTAAPGAGKTLVCQRLQAELSGRFEAVLLSSSGFATRRALLQAVLFSLGQSYESCSEQELRLSVLNHARTLTASREGIVLIIDEAHLLNARLLEELRCLTNHSQVGQPLIRVVLCGQLPLEDALVNPALEALNYRITCHATLEPMSMQESAQLIAGRLQRAGRPVEDVLTPEALETICRVSDGTPRCLVQLCDESLRIAAERKQAPVEVETVRLALQDLKQLPLHWNESAIDQPQTGAVRPGDEPIASGSGEPAASKDTAFTSGAEEPADASGDAPLGWSAAVTSVELGADGDSCEAPPATAGWSSFEPESGWESSGAGPSDEQDDAAADLPVCGQCNDTPTSAALPQAVDFSRGHEMTKDRAETGDIPAEPALADAQHRNGFVEVSVDDVYAALDAENGRTSAPCKSGSFDQMLRSAVTAAHHQPRRSVNEPVADAEPSGRHDAVVDLTPGSQADPVQRLDNVIAALSDVTAESPAVHSPCHSEWQSAGDACAFDVLEPGGEPQWDQAAGGSHPHEPDDRGAPQGRGIGESAHHQHRRPYARLFSRARQSQS